MKTARQHNEANFEMGEIETTDKPLGTYAHLVGPSLKEGADPLRVGDRIWYRRRGETFIHINYVKVVRERLIAVHKDKSRYVLEEQCYWLDLNEIEILDRESTT